MSDRDEFAAKAPFYYVPTEGLHVGSWCPTPTPTVPPTQVHLSIPMGDQGTMVLRFKSPKTLDTLIEALRKHRLDVWPEDG